MKVNADDTFEIMLSKEKRGENWLKIEEDTSLLMVRQTFLDSKSETTVDLKIEAIGVEGNPGLITPKQVDEGLNMASLFVAGAPMLFSKWANGFQKHSNRLPIFDPKVSNAAGGDANIIYYHSHWKLNESQALVIKVSPPECDTWNYQLNNYWMESLDYRYFDICINSHAAQINSDGTIMVIVAHQDPGFTNWIQTAGHFEGTMCWRWSRARSEPPKVIETQVVNFDDLKKIIHASS